MASLPDRGATQSAGWAGRTAQFPRALRRLAVWFGSGVLVVAIALLPLDRLLLALIGTLAVCLALFDPVFSIFWAILSVPVQETIHLPGGLSVTQAAMLLAVAAWGLRILAHPERFVLAGMRRSGAILFAAWCFWLVALSVSATFSPFLHTEAFKETLRWLEAFVIWLMVICLVRRRWQIVGLVASLLLAPSAEALIGLFQFATGDGPPSFRIASGLPFVRAYGTIGQPNSFAGYLNMAWPLAVALAVGFSIGLRRRRQGVARALAAWLAAGVLLAGLVASLSRGAWVGAVVGALALLGIAALRLGRRARFGFALVALAGALTLALSGVGVLPSFVAARLESITRYLAFFDAGTMPVTRENFAVVERMSQMQAAARMFLAYPFTGVGAGNYSVAYPQFAVGEWYASRGHAHNYYLHAAAETGILGLLAYLLLLAALVRQTVVSLRNARTTLGHSIAAGCCGIIAAVAAHNLFENVHVLSMGIQLAGVWGLLTVIETEANEALG